MSDGSTDARPGHLAEHADADNSKGTGRDGSEIARRLLFAGQKVQKRNRDKKACESAGTETDGQVL